MQNPVDSLGVTLRTAREKQNLTQRELADRLGMSVRTIIQVERGHSNPKFETVALLAKELNISLDAIIFPDSSVVPVSKSVVDFFPERVKQKFKNIFYYVNKQIPLNQNDKLGLHLMVFALFSFHKSAASIIKTSISSSSFLKPPTLFLVYPLFLRIFKKPMSQIHIGFSLLIIYVF